MKITKSFRRAVLPALLATFLLFAGAAGPASAAEPVSASMTAPAAVKTLTVDTSSVCGSGTQGDSSNALSVNRWGGSTTKFHSRIGGFDIGALNAVVQRNMGLSGGMAFGNGMWSGATSISSFAVNLCLLDSLGGSVDGFVSTIGDVITGSPILAVLLVVSTGALLVRGFKGAGPNAMKQLLGKLVIVAFFVMMVAGAGNSSGGGKNGDTGPYQPGMLSPGYFAVKVNNAVSSVTAIAPDLGVKLAGYVAPQNTQAPNGDWTACTPYINAMKAQYAAKYTGANSSSSMVPMILSQMWENTGLNAWKSAQFGTKSTAETESAYCHLLEMYSNSPVTNYDGGQGDPLHQRNLLMSISNLTSDQIKPSSKAFSTSDETMVDRSIIGWAACGATGGDPANESGWKIRAGFGDGAFADGARAITPKKCVDWWNNTSASLTDFDWSDNRGDIDKQTLMSDGRINENTRSFLLNFHGNDNTTGQFAVGGYVVAALCILIVFGLLSLAAIATKFAVLLYLPVFTFMLLKYLLPGTDNSGVFIQIKKFVGLVIGTLSINFIFALIAGISSVLSKAAPQDGSVWSMIWTGLAPVMAVFVIKMATKTMGLPNPFTISGAAAYGSSAVGAGGSAMDNMRGLGSSRNGMAHARRLGRRMMPNKWKMAGAAGTGAAIGVAATHHHDSAELKGARRNMDEALTNAKGRKRGMSSEAASAFKGMDAAAVDGVVSEASSVGALNIAAPSVAPTAAAGSFLSSVPNSRMGRMGSTAEERSQNASAARAERAAAKDYHKITKMTEPSYAENVRDAASAEKKAMGTQVGAFRQRPGLKSGASLVGSSIASGARLSGATVPGLKKAWNAGAAEFKNKPFKTSAKVLGGAALVATSLPLAVGVGAVVAGRKGVRYTARNLSENAVNGRKDAKVDNYRAARIAEVTNYKAVKDQKAAAERKAQRDAEKASRTSSAPSKAPRTQSMPHNLPEGTRAKISEMLGGKSGEGFFGGPALA